MKPKTMVLMIVAVVCGLGASYMTSRLLAEREEAPQQPVEIPKVKLLVAKHNLAEGQQIKNPKEVFVEKEFVQSNAPNNAIADPNMLKGKFLKRGLRQGDHITADDMDDNSGLSVRVPEGMRAVGIPVRLDTIASGWAATPGSRVDIIWNFRGRDTKGSFTKTLLEDVLVLAADQQDTRGEGGRAMPASVVTVALNPADANMVDVAMAHGNVRLVLRKQGEKNRVGEAAVVLDDLLAPEKQDVRTKKAGARGESDDNGKPPVVGDLNIPDVSPGSKDTKGGDGAAVNAEPQRFHVIKGSMGPKHYRILIPVDKDGNPVTDEVRRYEPESRPEAGNDPQARPSETPAEEKSKQPKNNTKN
jgi:Flp pilus assembly protein CpaB